MTETLKARYTALDSQRKVLVDRRYEFCELSIPGLMPRDGSSETGEELPVPFASVTARAVTRLASRITSAMLPLNGISCFSMELDDAQPTEGVDPSPESVVMGRIERRVMRKLNNTNLRSAIYLAVQHLEVIGDALFICNDNHSFTVVRFDQYVVRRRPDGEWHEIIYKMFVDPSMLPEALVKAGFKPEKPDLATPKQYDDNNQNCIYVQVVNDHKGGCEVKREYQGRVFETGNHPVCPYIPTRWSPGENYGRSLIEDNCGTVRSIEIMAEALLDSITANAEWRFGVNPAGLTEIHDLQTSENGSYVPAAQNDVFPIALGNQAQVAAAQQSVTLKEQEIGHIFLMNSAVQPQGERVTAYQVRLLATELEQALGGVFGDLARELLQPIIRYTMYLMLQRGTLVPDADPVAAGLKEELTKPDTLVSIRIRTGIEALNREVENEKMKGIMEIAVRLPEAAQQAIIWTGLVNRWMSTEGIEPKGLVYSAKEMEERAVAAQQAQMQQAAAQQAIQSGGAIAEQQAAGVTQQ